MIEGLSVSVWAASMGACGASATSSTYWPLFFQSTGLDVPVVGVAARGDVLGERDVGAVLDRDLVRVVPDHDEVAELLVARERGGLDGHALLQVAVGRDHVDVVVERARARRGVGVEQAALVAGA